MDLTLLYSIIVHIVQFFFLVLRPSQQFIYLGFKVSFNTLYRSYHDGYFYGQRKPVPTVGQGSVL